MEMFIDTAIKHHLPTNNLLTDAVWIVSTVLLKNRYSLKLNVDKRTEFKRWDVNDNCNIKKFSTV